MKLNTIYNEDCFDTLDRMKEHEFKVDTILTSPFYNTSKRAGTSGNLTNNSGNNGGYDALRYDSFVDNMTNEDYDKFTADLFVKFDSALSENGVVLYNISYGSENTTGMFTAINEIIVNTPFTIADVITWKKKTALPNNTSSNKLTRITEFVFVLVRKNDLETFKSNKKVSSVRENGQKYYENITNFVEAKNNDGACPINKATFSTDLCTKLLEMYAVKGDVIYDPFMGTGTTGLAAMNKGFNYVGSELSAKQCEWAEDRIEKESAQTSIFEYL